MTTLNVLQKLLHSDNPDHIDLRDWCQSRIEEHFQNQSVTTNLPLWLFAEDLISHLALVADAQLNLRQADEDPNPKLRAALTDDVHKAREKARKSLLEFIQACQQAGAPVPNGLADQFNELAKRLAIHGADLTQQLLDNKPDPACCPETLPTTCQPEVLPPACGEDACPTTG